MRRTLISLILVLISAPALAQTDLELTQKCMGGDAKLRITGCTALIQRYPTPSTAFVTQNLAVTYTSRGEAYSSEGLYDQAIADFTEAIKINPDYAAPVMRRGLAYGNKGQYELAIKDLDRVIQLSSNDADMAARGYYGLGLALRHLGQGTKADADFAKARQMNPNLPPP